MNTTRILKPIIAGALLCGSVAITGIGLGVGTPPKPGLMLGLAARQTTRRGHVTGAQGTLRFRSAIWLTTR